MNQSDDRAALERTRFLRPQHKADAFPGRALSKNHHSCLVAMNQSLRCAILKFCDFTLLIVTLRCTRNSVRSLETASITILVVDDYERWRRFVRLATQKRPEWQIISEVSDGLEAVQKAKELRPDLILLDIGLPSLNGIEAARRIRDLSPKSKILFVSENSSPEIAEAALSTGAGGYVVKADAANELLVAMEAVLQGRQFVSARLGASS
jgi:CheY-like chemotaxis protein